VLIIELSSEKQALQNIQNDCYEGLSDSCRVHQIRFRLGLCPGPHWGSSRRSPRPPSRPGRGTPPPHSPPTRCVRRLGLVACGNSSSAPRSQNPLQNFFLDMALPQCVETVDWATSVLKQETRLSLRNHATQCAICNAVDDLLKHSNSHMCYHAKFDRSMSYRQSSQCTRKFL